jgi:arylsulfatase
MRPHPPSVVVTILAAGALTGVADSLLTLAGSPDPGLLTYQLSYVFGPVLFALIWAGATGAIAAELARWRGGTVHTMANAAAGSIVTVWAASLLVEAWSAGQSVAALAVLAVGLGLGSLALARLAIDVAARMAACSLPARRVLAIGTGAVLFGGVLAGTPRGASSFRGGTGPCNAPRPTAPGHNVVLITVDALRTDEAQTMSSYRRLQSRGRAFTQHVTTSPWTLPSVASLLTGLPPEEHGAGQSLSSRSLVRRTALRTDVATLAGLLGAQGYATHAVATNPYLTAHYGIDRGFCTFENVSMEGEAVRALRHTTQLRWARVLASRWLPSDRAPEVRTRAERWLARHGEQPFFLWLHFLDPHAPYGDRHGGSTSLVLDLMAFQGPGATGVPFRAVGLTRAGEYRPGPEERRQIRALYQEDVAFVDGQIELFLDFLIARGLDRTTAVVLTADHGEEFWEHGGLEHGRTLYEEVLRVPLVVATPGHVRGSLADLTTVLDITPTILALAGYPHTELPGRNLLGDTLAPAERLPIGQTLFGENWSGVRAPGCKSMRSEYGEERVFDLKSDPDEHLNLAAIQMDGHRLCEAPLGPPAARL